MFRAAGLFCLLLLHSPDSLPAQWTDRSTWRGDFSDIAFFDELTGLATGESYPEPGTDIFRSTDGGAYWNLVFHTDLAYHQAIATPAPGIAFATAGIEVIKSTDGGLNWSPVYSGTDDGQQVVFTDALHGYVNYSSFLAKTTDGGANWSQIFIAPFSATNTFITGMDFISTDEGWIVNSGTVDSTVYHTTDGGNSWVAMLPTVGWADFAWVDFLDAQHGMAIDASGEVYLTTDGGLTWDLNVFAPDEAMKRAYYAAPDRAWVVYDDDKMYYSADSGLSWNAVTTPSHGGFLAMDRVNDSVSFACGAQGFVYKSTNDGLNWDAVLRNSHGVFTRILPLGLDSAIFFASLTHRYPGEPGDCMLYTGDAGSTYEFRDTFPRGVVNAVDLSHIGTQLLWLAQPAPGFAGSRSTDGGLTWQAMPCAGCLFGTEAIHFTDDSTGWALSQVSMVIDADYRVFHSSDGGASWTAGTLFPDVAFANDLWFFDDQTGVVAIADDIWRTDDGGSSWTLVHEVTSTTFGYYVKRFFFINDQEGWAVGEWGMIRHTTDAGLNWTIIPAPTHFHIHAIFFHDSNRGYIADMLGRVFKTTDGGLNWGMQMDVDGLDNELEITDLVFTDTSRGWFVTAFGEIYHTDNGGGPTTMSAATPDFPSIAAYPNPFHDRIHLEFSAWEMAGPVSLHLHDLSGRELAHRDVLLTSASQDWELPGLPEGIYFLRVQAGDRASTVKLVKQSSE